MRHGVVEVFAYQETLLMMAIFGFAILAMVWIGFRRWLQYKERMGRLIAEQMAERTAQYGVNMERVEARLNSIEQAVALDGADTTGRMDVPRTGSLAEPASKRDA